MANVIGIGLTMVGVVIGIFPPKVTAQWDGPHAQRKERLLVVRYAISVAFVIVGSAMQMWGAWSS